MKQKKIKKYNNYFEDDDTIYTDTVDLKRLNIWKDVKKKSNECRHKIMLKGNPNRPEFYIPRKYVNKKAKKSQSFNLDRALRLCPDIKTVCC